jgi:hypothetical protein
MPGVAMIGEMKLMISGRSPVAGGKKRYLPAIIGAVLFSCFILPTSLSAADETATPFYYANATPFDAQVRTLIVGVNENIGQAVVSKDRKYVTLNLDTGLLGNAGIQKFNYQRGGIGFVGTAPKHPAPAAGNGLTPSIAGSAGEISPAVSVLDRPGMVLIAPMER